MTEQKTNKHYPISKRSMKTVKGVLSRWGRDWSSRSNNSWRRGHKLLRKLGSSVLINRNIWRTNSKKTLPNWTLSKRNCWERPKMHEQPMRHSILKFSTNRYSVESSLNYSMGWVPTYQLWVWRAVTTATIEGTATRRQKPDESSTKTIFCCRRSSTL